MSARRLFFLIAHLMLLMTAGCSSPGIVVHIEGANTAAGLTAQVTLANQTSDVHAFDAQTTEFTLDLASDASGVLTVFVTGLDSSGCAISYGSAGDTLDGSGSSVDLTVVLATITRDCSQ